MKKAPSSRITTAGGMQTPGQGLGLAVQVGSGATITVGTGVHQLEPLKNTSGTGQKSNSPTNDLWQMQG